MTALSEDKQNPLFFDNSKSSSFKLLLCLWVPQIALKQGRRPANDTRGGPRYCLARKLPATLETGTSPSTATMAKAEPAGNQQPRRQHPRGQWEECPWGNWLNSPPPFAVSHTVCQTHKGTGKHTLTAIAMLLSTRRINQLITARGRRLFHPELRFYPSHSQSFSMHILLMAVCSPSVQKYTHIYMHDK